MSDVVLVYPPYSFVKDKQLLLAKFSSSPPLGLLYLASSLEANELEVDIVDAMSNPIELGDITKLVEQSGARLVGISSTTPQTRGALQLAIALRKAFGDKVVVGLGGAHVTADPDFIRRFPYLDFGFIGEGEETFPKIVQEILEGKVPEQGTIIQGKRVSNLDDVPFPARHLLEKNLYGEGKESFAPIMASRGCPYNCIFCSKPILGRGVRHRSPKNVVDEMESIGDEYQWRFVFADDTFTLNRKLVTQLCKEMIDRKIESEWQCETRINLVDEDLLEMMKKAGCKKIEFGVESGCERVRINIVRKNFTNEQVMRVFSLCKKIGIQTAAYLMLGFPTETRDEMQQTVEIGSKINADFIGVHLTVPMPGSDIFAVAKNEGRISADVWDRYARGELDEQPIYVPETLSLEEMKNAQKDAYRRFYFRRRFLMKRFVHDLNSLGDFKNDIFVALSLLKHGRTATGRP